MTDQTTEERKHEVLKRHARMSARTQKPEVCAPSPNRFQRGPREPHVIFSNEDAAKAAAAELAEIFGGAPQRPVPCPRSRTGHFHLTSRHA